MKTTQKWDIRELEVETMVIARSSSLLGKITVLVLFVLCVKTAVALDGSGTQEDPWRIKSLEDFNDFAADANYWAGFTRLETDVNLAGKIYSTAVIAMDMNSSEYYFQGTKFTSAFDGNDHKIMNLTIDDGGAGRDFVGLFGYIIEDGEVRNLGLEGGSVSGGRYVGGLVGANSGSVSNCYYTGDVSGGSWDVGGLVGLNRGSISNCYFAGAVSGHDVVGGLVGYDDGSILNSYSTSSVSGGENVGGLVGINWGIVSNCYSTDSVNGNGSYVAGMVGANAGSVSNCYSIGDVNGVAGLVGVNYSDGSASDCFWDTDTQTHSVTNSIGYNEGTTTNVAGLPTSQLHQQSTFTNWNFIDIWNIGENQTYPYLRTYLAADLNKDGIVNFLDLSITANQWMEGAE